MSTLTLKGLSKSYNNLIALDNIDLELTSGHIVGLLGPNGSGKTTLIKLANGLLRPTHGEILINGLPPGPETKAVVSYLPDRDYLPSHMKVHQTLTMFGDYFADFDRSRAESMIKNLGLDMNARVKSLSKGNREKLELILAMSRRAEIYLLDEPIAGVDPATRDYILHTIISNYSEDALMIISTHLISDVEPILDDIIFIQQGHIFLHEDADSLRERTGLSIDKSFREMFHF